MRCANLDQLALSDSGTHLAGLCPLPPGLDELRPERKEPALGGLGRVDFAAGFGKEGALAEARFAEAEQVAGAVNVAAFEFGGAQAQEAGGLPEVFLRQVDKAPHVAAADAAGLTLEAQTVHV